MIIITLGPPGAGKSTQAKLLAKKLGLSAISMGQVLRDAKKTNTALGLEAAKFVEDGKLVPARLMRVLTNFRLDNDDCKDGFLLDGTPRRVDEAVMLDEYLAGRNMKINRVLVLEIDDEQLIQRLLLRAKLSEKKGEKRQDDNMQDIKVRLSEYYDNIEAIKIYYRRKDVLVRVDGRGTVEEIHQRICRLFKI